VPDLISANNLDADGDIQAGQKLVLPGTAAAPTAKAPAEAATKTITIAAGDTLYGIATKYNTTIESLMKLNKLDSPDSLQAGQTLKVASA
jgi:LysM repeat protein